MNTGLVTDDALLFRLVPLFNGRRETVAWALACEAVEAEDDVAYVRMEMKALLETQQLFGLLRGLPLVVFVRASWLLQPTFVSLFPAKQTRFVLPQAQFIPAVQTVVGALENQGFAIWIDLDPHALAQWQQLPLHLVSGCRLASSQANSLMQAAASLPVRWWLDEQTRFPAQLQPAVQWYAGSVLVTRAATPQTEGGRLILVRLLSLLIDDADTNEIEKVFKQEPRLSFNLLRLVNSVSMGLSTKIATFRQALTLLGRRQLQRWLQLLLYAQQQSEKQSPDALMTLAAQRGKLMEALVKIGAHPSVDVDYHDRAFMVGSFSLLDALLGIPMHEIVAKLNLAEDISQALLARQGALGAWLALLEAQEQGDFARLRRDLQVQGVSHADFQQAQLQAYRWASYLSLEA